MKAYNFFITGVGGQGTLLASDIVALVGAAAGYDVKKSEVHGMSQRGGSVVSQVRWDDHVYAPLVGHGQVDYLIAFEKLEALRYIEYLKPNGIALINDHDIPPVAVNLGQEEYPEDGHIQQILRQYSPNVYYLDAISIADEIGNARANNVVMLGALSNLIDIQEAIWLQIVGQRVPERYRTLNLEAFAAGRDALQQ